MTDVGSESVERARDRYWKDGRRHEQEEPTGGKQGEERDDHERIIPFRGLAYLVRDTWANWVVAW